MAAKPVPKRAARPPVPVFKASDRHPLDPLDPGQPAQLTVDRLPEPVDSDDTGALTPADRAKLTECEAAVDQLRAAFWAAGKALEVISRGRLYRETHDTFEDYCLDRWNFTPQHAGRLIKSWRLGAAMEPIGSKIGARPNEGQARELVPVATVHDEQAAIAVYEAVVDTLAATPEPDRPRLTAAILKGVVATLPPMNGSFDQESAAEHVRAYLAGELDQPQTAVDWTSETRKLRRTLQRIRAVKAADPDEARAIAAELRKTADELERAGG